LGGGAGSDRSNAPTEYESGPPPQVPRGGILKGATLVDPNVPGKGRTKVEPGIPPVARPGGLSGGNKGKTVFDSGVSDESADSAPGAAHAGLSGAKLVGWLVTFNNTPSGADFRVTEGRNNIGSNPTDCDILISSDPSISSIHAVIMFRQGSFRIRDNDSQNGTFVNGKDIFGDGAVELNDRDSIRIGHTEFKLYVID